MRQRASNLEAVLFHPIDDLGELRLGHGDAGVGAAVVQADFVTFDDGGTGEQDVGDVTDPFV